MKYIFLDFDGVLHGEGIQRHKLFEHAPKLCDAIRPYIKTTRIIISSSWRCDYSLDEMTQYFDDDIRKIFVGTTPILEESFMPCGRYYEIQKYCDENKIASNAWVALDDMARLFPQNLYNLILVDSCTGIGEKELKKLIQFLRK